jgi:predicted MFS family arabinose efflux permease
VALQHWLYMFGQDKFSAEAVNATFTAVVQVAVASGSLLSGVAVNAAGVRSSAILGTVASGLACAVALIFMAAASRRSATAAKEPPVTVAQDDVRIAAVD